MGGCQSNLANLRGRCCLPRSTSSQTDGDEGLVGPADEGEERDRVGGGEGVGSEEEEGGVGVGTRHARRQRRREGYDAPVGPDGRETEEYLILLAFSQISPFILYFFSDHHYERLCRAMSSLHVGHPYQFRHQNALSA